MFHPYEIALCGLSGSGKSTLMEKLILHFTRKGYEVACFKHGCHRFDIDREGKDSDRFTKAGAIPVMISDREKQAVMSIGTAGIDTAAISLCADMLFIEGLKELPVPKLLFIDTSHDLLPLLEHERIPEVLTLVHSGNSEGLDRFGLPCFERDDVAGISDFIMEFFRKKVSALPFNGLVLAGGYSSRMGRNKAMLRYHEQNQLDRTARLLSSLCDRVFVSCRKEQLETYALAGLPAITDSYLDMGPLGGLLSAQRHTPEAAWLLAACDLPFIDDRTLSALHERRNPFRFATAFIADDKGRPKPLLAIYEPKSRRRLLERHASGNDSLQSFLMNSQVMLIEPVDSSTLLNVNDPEDLAKACQLIGKSNS
jgi:molybdopterin-guanine dinucleotide biosynthesis protein A